MSPGPQSDAPAPAVDHGPSHPPLTVGSDEPCCCDHITLYLETVAVLSATAVPGLPIIGLLGKIIDDHVIVQCESCDGKIVIWPDNKPGQEIPTGNTPVRVGAPLATISHPQNSCWVSCHVKVQAFRASRLAALLNALNALLPQLAQALAAYFAATSAAAAAHNAVGVAGAALAGAAPQSPAKPSLQQSLLDAILHAADADADAAKLDARVKDLQAKIDALEKVLLGLDDNLMGQFHFSFEGPLDCKKGVLEAVEDPTDGKADPNDPNSATFTQSVRAHVGEWLLTFRAVKSCPAAKGK
jgi:hypothetical protein